MYTVDMKINNENSDRVRMSRPLRLALNEPDQKTDAVRLAQVMVISARENVRFLNRHFAKYSHFMQLPHIADNALYLAYTVKIQEQAPFTSKDLQKFLAEHDIETRSSYAFWPDPETMFSIMAGGRLAVSMTSDSADDTCCLPCHHGLSILDLQYLIETIDDFFRIQENRYVG